MLLAILAAAATAAPGASLPAGYSAPDWLKRPSSDDLRAVWPANALSHEVVGKVKLHCEVNVHGLLEQCRVTSEIPAGAGFGAAALLLTPSFVMRPATGPNGPIPSSVSIPITFGTGDGGLDEGDRMAMISHPVWLAAPTFAEVGVAYPRSGAGEPGHVTFRCRVNADGGLHACEDLTEEPHGKGFAAAARSLVKKFRLAPFPPGENRDAIYINLPIRLTSPQSVDFRDHHIGRPTWIRNLDPAKVVQVYPAAAAAKGVQTGRGVSQCTVALDGSLVGCKPLAGEPDGLGFSESAVAVASVMKMNPWTEEGGPVDGAVVRIPIRFNLASDEPSGPPAKTAAPVIEEGAPVPSAKTASPAWLYVPSPAAIAAAYPKAAIDTGQGGRVLLDCQIRIDGRMDQCSVVEETPRGFGFGAAALKLSADFLMTPGFGANSPNRPHMRLPINFLRR